MSSNNVNLGLDNNILKFLDNHFILEKIIESKLNKEDLNTLKKEYLAKTRLFNKQKELANEKEIEELTKTSELISKQEEDTKSTIKGFLNLIDNFRKIGNFDTSALIHKKIIDETSANKVLEYANILYETGRYEESRSILTDFYQIFKENKKNLTKSILALWKLLAINLLIGRNDEVFFIFEEIKKVINSLKQNLEDDFRKVNVDSTDKMQFDFKHILLHRGYLIHWSLSLLNYSEEGIDSFLNLVFSQEYYSLIENSFTYMFKYLIIFSIISKSKINVQTLKNTFNSLSFEDPFVKLFNAIFVNFETENSFALIDECVGIMNSNYFLASYSKEFVEKCKECILDNHISLSTSIDLKLFAGYFRETLEETEKFVNKFMMLNHPGEVTEKKENVIHFEISSEDIEKYHVLRAKELFDVTTNMIEVVRLGRQMKK